MMVDARLANADIGGQIGDHPESRPLSNIPLVWMLDRAEQVGLPLPPGWRGLFPGDPAAPSIGSWRNWGKAFLARTPRLAGRYMTEALHPTVPRPVAGPARLTGHLAAHRPPRRRSPAIIAARWRRPPVDPA